MECDDITVKFRKQQFVNFSCWYENLKAFVCTELIIYCQRWNGGWGQKDLLQDVESWYKSSCRPTILKGYMNCGEVKKWILLSYEKMTQNFVEVDRFVTSCRQRTIVSINHFSSTASLGIESKSSLIWNMNRAYCEKNKFIVSFWGTYQLEVVTHWTSNHQLQVVGFSFFLNTTSCRLVQHIKWS